MPYAENSQGESNSVFINGSPSSVPTPVPGQTQIFVDSVTKKAASKDDTGAVTRYYGPPLGYVRRGKAGWTSVSAVTLGASGITSEATAQDGSMVISWSGALSASIASSGAGGLDTGSEAANTWYGILVIADSSGVNSPAAMLTVSTGATFPHVSPTLPSGYDKYRRLGWVRNNASSNFLKFSQSATGCTFRIFYDENRATVQALTGFATTTFTALSLAAFLPPSATDAYLLMDYDNAAGSAGDDARVRMSGSSVTSTTFSVQPGAAVGAVDDYRQQIIVPVDTSQAVEVAVENALNSLDIFVQGYTDDV